MTTPPSSPPQKPDQHAWFSKQQYDCKIQMLDDPENCYGTQHYSFQKPPRKYRHVTNIYLSTGGQEIEVTMVSDKSTHGSKWTDMIYLGTVSKWVRSGPDV